MANQYILLTPGPLTTTNTVKEAMLKDWCTWDAEYNNLVQDLRDRVLSIGVKNKDAYSTVLMQGSGTFSVESVIGSTVGKDDKLLVLTNGAYGDRIGEIAEMLNLDYKSINFGESGAIDLAVVESELSSAKYTHVAVVHCETTTGRLNPIFELSAIVKKHNITYIVDAMSSYGGIAIDVEALDCDFLISSSNKCIQGVPGFGFIVAKKQAIEACKGKAKSLSLDLYGQWSAMEKGNGKWRFTSPTHVVRAFYQALLELEQEGGVNAREARYRANHKVLIDGMRSLGFETLVNDEQMSPIITTFCVPENSNFSFNEFYKNLKTKGFVIYPGKLTERETFRIGNIGDVTPENMKSLILAIESSI